MPTTTETVTTQQIEALRTEAGAVGDTEQVRLCDAALDGDEQARGEVVKAIRDAEAMA